MNELNMMITLLFQIEDKQDKVMKFVNVFDCHRVAVNKPFVM
jgi:hypothetical protein